MNFVRFVKSMFGRQAWFVSFLAVALVLLPAVTYADPPPWAPAWGYRGKGKDKNDRKHERKKDRKHKYEDDRDDDWEYYERVQTDIQAGTCSRDLIGGMLGGVAGGYAGSQFGKGDGKVAMTAVGAVLGVIVGSKIGQRMDEVDVRCTGYALEAAEDKQKVVWQNPDNGGEYAVTPTRTYEKADRYCREFTTRTTVDGETQVTNGQACRNPDGSWEMMD